MNGILSELNIFEKGSLKKTSIRVRDRRGNIHEEVLGEDGIETTKFISSDDLALVDDDKGYSELKVYKFTGSKWELTPYASSDTANCEELSFISYNVWFKDFHLEQRGIALVGLLQQYNVDIFCLQEVTPAFLRILVSNEWIKDRFYLSDNSPGLTVYPYGVLIGSRFPFSCLKIFRLPSNMGRRFLQGTVHVNGHDIAVGTVHLESMRNREMRIEQLGIIWPAMESSQNAFFMGDTNIRDDYEEVKYFDPSYDDVWRRLHTGDPGFTCDHGARIDRIFSKTADYRAVQIEIIGREEIPALPTTPSDHFGLYTRFARSQK